MQYTTHYNLNLPEGSDIVNPLVQDNPNYSEIDTALYDNKVRVVGNATEIKSGTVHAITRSDSDIDVVRFTATGDWITGDTMTVDGSPVSVYLQDGTAPLTSAYVINTEVVAVINGSRVTLYGAQKLPAYTASDISYDNTVSGLNATDVQDAVDEVVNDLNNIIASESWTEYYTGSAGEGSHPGNLTTYKEILIVITDVNNGLRAQTVLDVNKCYKVSGYQNLFNAIHNSALASGGLIMTNSNFEVILPQAGTLYGLYVR